MKFCFLFFLFNLILVPGVLFAQPDSCNAVLKGNVLDGETGKPFQYASVFIKEFQKGASTDSNGFFQINNLCQGKVTVVYSALGYKSFTTSYKLNSDIRIDQIILHTDTCQLESVTVYGKKAEEIGSFTRASLTGKELDRTRGLSLGDALKELPGVTTLKTGNSISKPVIHGLHSNRVLVLNAGLRQEGQQWGNEHAPEIDPFVSDKMTVVKGAAGVRYGSDAIAGVVIVEPRNLPLKTGINGEMNLVGMSNNRQGTVSGLLEGKFGKWLPLMWRLQGTMSKAGNVKAPHYYQANTGFEEKNFSYAVGYNRKWFSGEIFYSQFNTTLGIFSGSHIGSVSDLQNAIEKSEPAVKSGFSYEINRPFQHVEHELVRAKFSAYLAKIGSLNLLLGRQFNNRSEFDVLRNSIANESKEIPQLQLKLTTHSADLVLEHKPFKNISGSIGTVYMQQANIWQGRFLIPNFKSQSFGGFIIEKWGLGKTDLEAGLRYDKKFLDIYLNDNGIVKLLPYSFSNFSGTVGAIYKISKALNWRTNAGTTWRPPNVNELFSKGLHHGAAAIEIGDPTLKPEQAFKLVTSLEAKSEKLNLESSLFYSQIQNFIYLKPDLELVQTIRGAFPSFTYTQIDARFYGSDLFASYEMSKSINLIVKGSLVLAENITEKGYLINIPPIRYSPAIVYRPRFIKEAYNSYLRFTLNRTENQWRVPENSDYANPPAAYTLFDAEAGTDLLFGKQKVSIIFQVNNLFDVAYRDYMNRFRYFTDEMGRNFTLRIKVPVSIYNKN